jgi:hypothetical protein
MVPDARFGRVFIEALSLALGARVKSHKAQLSDLAKWVIFSRGRRGKAERLNLDRDFAVDELAVVYPILNAIFDPIPIFAEEADSFVRGRIG